MAEYFVQKAVPLAVASIYDEKGASPINSVVFVLDLLKQYDNSRNDRNDAPFLATLLDAAALLRAPREPPQVCLYRMAQTSHSSFSFHNTTYHYLFHNTTYHYLFP